MILYFKEKSMALTQSSNDVYKSLYKFVWNDDLFSKKELEKINKYCKKLSLQNGQIGDGNIDNNIRQSKVALVGANEDNDWLFALLNRAAENINNDFYRFDLTGFDYFQYTEYRDRNDHYDFHVDMTYDSPNDNANLDGFYQNRKLSFSILLNDPKEFSGADFEFSDSGDPDHVVVAEQRKGRVIAFPSFVPHRVTPLMSGVRKSLVFWVTGPKFR